LDEAIIKVGKKAQITLPKAIRDKLKISEGDRVSVKLEGTEIVITPVVPLPRQNYVTEEDLNEALAEAESEFAAGEVKIYEDAEELFKDAGWVAKEPEDR